MTLWILLLAIAGLGGVLTGVLRRYALDKSIIDIPNARSSHSIPTPRGGGVSIVISFLLGAPLLSIAGLLDWSVCWALLGAGGGVALLGFLDDHGHIAARWRLLGHFAAALWVVCWVNGLAPLNILDVALEFGWVGNIIATFYLVWLLNLYNFMDGIDGLASVEAICVCLGGGLLYALVGQFDYAWTPIALACAVLGFLFWNFPPAKIFMGDAGSGFLGVVLGVLSLQAAWVEAQLFFCWLILLGVFIVDATFTLFFRLLRGEKVYQAHRSHAYQFASRKYGSHLRVTVSVAVINLSYLLPIASAVAVGLLDGVVGVFVAYVPLVILAYKFKAGQVN